MKHRLECLIYLPPRERGWCPVMYVLPVAAELALAVTVPGAGVVLGWPPEQQVYVNNNTSLLVFFLVHLLCQWQEGKKR